jgi:c-di-GMP phosphodiesterase
MRSETIYLFKQNFSLGAKMLSSSNRSIEGSGLVAAKPVMLVVDDDPLFCAQIRQYARNHYQYFSSLDPRKIDAKVLASASIVVLDLNMPDCDGVELIKSFAAMSPAPRLLIASGCDQRVLDLARQTAELYGLKSTTVLRKPFNRTQFFDKLELLDRMPRESFRLVSNQVLPRLEEGHIASGMLAGQFVAYYQPQIDVSKGTVVGIEALARWQHPDYGFMTPMSFIETIELSKLAMEFTLLIIESAMQDYLTLRAATGYSGKLSINVPSEVFDNEQFASLVIDLAQKYNFPTEKLVCEFTERGVEKIEPETVATLTRLKMHDIQLSIDDFGTGQSGLSKLKSRAFDEIKIDRSFVKDISTSSESRLIVESICNLAAQSRLRVIIEGVEDKKTLDCINEFCDPLVQGFYFSKPLHINQLIPWLLDWPSRNDWADDMV